MTAASRSWRAKNIRFASRLCALFITAGAVSTSLHAQTMYRCGTVYQDRPCEGAQEGKVIGRTGASRPPAAVTSDASCARRGAAAQKMVWAREGGATEEKALSEARSNEDRKIIFEVYRNRGTSSEVRSSVEADCMADKERMGDVQTMMEAPSAKVRARSIEPESRPQVSSIGKDTSSREAVRKKSDCEYMKAQLESISIRQRNGSSAATMESLNMDRRDLNARMSQAGC